MGFSLNWITDSVVGQVPIVSADTPALAFDDHEPVSWGELREAELRYASALQRAGVGKGDRVAILMQNCAEYSYAMMGITRLGAIAVRLNWRLTGPELTFILDDSGSSVLLFDERFRVTVDTIRAELPVHTYIERGEIAPPEWAGALTEFVAGPADGEFPELDASDPATIMYTSGTTGLPKGAVLTHGNLLWIASIQVMKYKLDATDVMLVPGPMFHAGAWEFMMLPTLLVHGTGVHFRSGGFTLEGLFAVARQHSATQMMVYTHQVYDLLREPDVGSIVPKSLRRIVAGGDTVMPWVYDEFEKRLPGVAVEQNYSLTEGGVVDSVLEHAFARGHESSVGRPYPLCEIKILDSEGHLVEVGEVGEIYTRTPGVSVGYWNRDEVNAKTFKDGWCRTGDLGRFDEEGFLSLAGREKDMIRSGGENIYPAEIETVLTAHEAIADAAVIGVPDEKYFEVGCALLVAPPGVSIDTDAVREHLTGRLAKYKIPKHFVVVEELLRNSTGKVRKNILREMYAGLGSSMAEQ